MKTYKKNRIKTLSCIIHRYKLLICLCVLLSVLKTNILTAQSCGTNSSGYQVTQYSKVGNESFFSISQGIPALQWAKTLNGSANADDGANAITVDASGNVYVTGSTSETSASNDYMTIKYNTIGDTVWTRRYNGTTNGSDAAGAIFVDGSGNVYVTGSSEGSGTALDYLTIKYNSIGDTVWTRRYNNSPRNGDDQATSILVDASGNVYVTGGSVEGIYMDYLTIAYNSSGAVIWTDRYEGTGAQVDRAVAIAVDASGNTYVTGFSYGGVENNNYVTIKYSAIGSRLWTSIYNNPANNSNEPSSMAIDGLGNAFITGRSYTSGTDYDFVTVMYNSDGIQKWVASYNGTGNGPDEAKSIVVDGSGNTYVTGHSMGIGTSYDYATIKYNKLGTQKWVVRYNKGHDFATSIALDNTGPGYVYVTGRSDGASTFDYSTVKYSLSGVQQGAVEYNGAANGSDETSGIKVDALGNVYVTGYSAGTGTGYDFATIKYGYTSLSKITSNNPLDVKGTETHNSVTKSQSVEIASFVSSIDKNNITLNWETIRETDNSGFDIERSSSADAWTKIADVAGNGTANSSHAYTYLDRNIPTGKYQYRLKQTDFNGNFEYYNLSNEVIVGVPSEYNLLQNYPNPFNPTTNINFEIPSDGKVSLKVFDISGKEVATLVNEVKTAGYYSIQFNGSNLSSGMYFYRIVSGNFKDTKKMVILK